MGRRRQFAARACRATGRLSAFALGLAGRVEARQLVSAVAERTNARLATAAERYRITADDDLVFCHPALGTVLDPSKLRKRFVTAVSRAGLRPTRLHDLRHTFGTRMAAAGAPRRAIQEWMGHRSSQTTEIYADYAPDVTMGAVWAERAFASPPKTGEHESPQLVMISGLTTPAPATIPAVDQ